MKSFFERGYHVGPKSDFVAYMNGNAQKKDTDKRRSTMEDDEDEIEEVKQISGNVTGKVGVFIAQIFSLILTFVAFTSRFAWIRD
jgi:hypothetical protein